jgi:uncharacterized protein Usg
MPTHATGEPTWVREILKVSCAGLRLTTAEITYRMPDFRDIMQIYIWQDYDLAPRFPKLIKFLDFWSHNLDGPLATIRVAQAGLVAPARLSYVGTEWRLH